MDTPTTITIGTNIYPFVYVFLESIQRGPVVGHCLDLSPVTEVRGVRICYME